VAKVSIIPPRSLAALLAQKLHTSNQFFINNLLRRMMNRVVLKKGFRSPVSKKRSSIWVSPPNRLLRSRRLSFYNPRKEKVASERFLEIDSLTPFFNTLKFTHVAIRRKKTARILAVCRSSKCMCTDGLASWASSTRRVWSWESCGGDFFSPEGTPSGPGPNQ